MTHNIDRRVLLRALIEDPDIDHEAEVGSEMELEDWDLDDRVLAKVSRFEHEHPDNLLAQTQVVRRELMLALDLAAVVAKFEQVKGDA
jgi:hypothetical protein